MIITIADDINYADDNYYSYYYEVMKILMLIINSSSSYVVIIISYASPYDVLHMQACSKLHVSASATQWWWLLLDMPMIITDNYSDDNYSHRAGT